MAVAGVPCSLLRHAIKALQDHPRLAYVAAPNEGPALGIACGHELAGRKAAVILQDSGFGNLINPLTSLALTYGLTPLIIVSRHDARTDELQHRAMAELTDVIIDHLKLPHIKIAAETVDFSVLADDLLAARSERRPIVLSVARGAITGSDMPPPLAARDRSLTRARAIEVLLERISEHVPIIATTGFIARELRRVRDRGRNFYMLGSMGHAAAIALGFAQGEAASIVLDGDGAVLMHLGLLATTAAEGGPGLLHVILDNGVYESTGAQATAASTVSLRDIGATCGYKTASECVSECELRVTFNHVLAWPGPHLVIAKIQSISQPTPETIFVHKSAEQIRDEFVRYKAMDPVCSRASDQLMSETSCG
ncbi:thiamine pyrophosphate-dependent enzyme [Bradyrhizobium ganzhouense]|uniref:thiamine pyrophosphate-dependent enzyme n=1 Tax=Bradyrhizobium ganzhouense TaxID=1179767 RepID=UPI003CF9ACFB